MRSGSESINIPTQTKCRAITFALSEESESNSARAGFSNSSPVTSSGITGSTIRGRKRVGSLDRPIGVLGVIARPLRSPAVLEIPGRVAPARSGLPPLGLSERGRSEELLCGREELLLVDDLLLEGPPDDGLPLEEVPDVERDGGRPLDGRSDEGRDPLDGGRRESMSLLHSE